MGKALSLKWRAKYSGLEDSDVKKLCQVEDENRRLKQMMAEQARQRDDPELRMRMERFLRAAS